MSVMNGLLAFYADMKEAMEYDNSVEATEEVVDEETDDTANSRSKAAEALPQTHSKLFAPK